jgi:hypothetical protein
MGWCRRIKLTQGKYALIDANYFEWLNRYKWYYHNGYAVRTIAHGKKWVTIRMHRLILNAAKGTRVNHINQVKLDNRFKNLRISTASQNGANSKLLAKNNKSGYKGVSWYIRHKKWAAGIKVEYKRKHLGYFKSKIDAAKAYDKAAVKYFGKFAHLNFKEKTDV